MRLLAIALALVLALPLAARAADPDAGRQKSALCAGCHGAQGISSIPSIPSLAGQRERFMGWQLVFFRSGRRANPAMTALAAQMSDEDINDLAAYYASLPRGTAPRQADPALAAHGREVADVHRCAACHTDTFEGNQAAPAIADQQGEYLAKALADYRSSSRPSVGVAAMTEAAASLTDDDIHALAAFLESYK